MIVVRSLAEAAAWCHLTGHAVLSRRSPRPQAHIWDCVWRDESRELVFVEQASEAPSKLLDRDGFVQVGAELLAAVPATPLGFVRGEARRCIADLFLAGYCFTEALRGGAAEAVATALAAADERRRVWAAALGQLPEARAVLSIPVPPHGFVPAPALALWFARPTPFPTAEIPDELGVVARGEDGRFLARHPAHSLAWLSVGENRMVTAIEALAGQPALAALLAHGFSLLEVQKARLRAAGQPGDPLAQLLEEGLGLGQRRVVLEVRGGGDRVRFVEVETRDPRFRGALLAIRLDGDERVLGFRVIEGVDGYEMMGLLDATAPHLPGPNGEPPVAASAASLEASLVQIGGAVRPLLEALVDPAKAAELIETLRPRPGDAARAFLGSEADLAAIDARYAELWAREAPRVRAPAAEVSLRILVATGGMLLPDAPMAKVFPANWAKVAERLRPASTWVAWAYEPKAGGRALDYDGLVWLDDRWVWFPAPWRVLSRG